MKVHDRLDAWRETRRAWPQDGLGFVPTMGGLHEGHQSLVQRSAAENPVTVVSLFLNATQFDHAGDLENYPAELSRDLALLAEWGADHVLLPSHEDMYPDDYRFRVSEHDLAQRLEGAHRPGHFDGMLTVVLKLLNLVRPERAYFGEKDWQQLQLVRGMVAALFLDVTIVPCATVRERDGLALSSRNARLDDAQRALAPALHRSLVESATADEAAQRLAALGFEVDYVSDSDHRRLAAARLGTTRLIDNVPLVPLVPLVPREAAHAP